VKTVSKDSIDIVNGLVEASVGHTGVQFINVFLNIIGNRLCVEDDCVIE
jgi:hypothetical protein